MRIPHLAILLATPLALGACASPLGGIGGGGLGGLGGILEGVLGGGNSGGGYNNQNFERAAVDACGRQASQYGRVSISNVERRDNSMLRVYGRVDDGQYQSRNFACIYRSDGRITEFDLAR